MRALRRTSSVGRVGGRRDSLTRLPTRPLFLDRVDRAIERCQRQGTQLAVLCLDLDRFNAINDSLSHDIGDHLLRAVAQRVETALSQGDSAARLAGDEFAILLTDVRDEAEVLVFAERLRRELNEPYRLARSELHVSASIGIAAAAGSDRGAQELVRDAAAAMKRAKALGKDRVELFDLSMRVHAQQRAQLESALHRAVDLGELRVHYQPEVELATGRVVGAEALVRWQRPDHGLVMPADFIPIAEEIGLIEAIGDWVLFEACREAARWPSEEGTSSTIWVNLSARQLGRPGIVDTVARRITEAGLAPSRIGLEITESALFADVDAVVRTLHKLAELGVPLAVDDFGTGYSSLSYLKRLPVRAVKIDQSFVAGLAHDHDDAAIVAAVIGMAHALRLTTIAEGVETPEQLAALRALGCDFAQGYFFGPPLPAPALGPMFGHGASWTALLPEQRATDDHLLDLGRTTTE